MSIATKTVEQVMSEALHKLGLSDEEMQHLAHSGSRLEEHLGETLERLVQEVRQPMTEELAREIMGRNFIGLNEIRRWLAVDDLDLNLTSLSTIPFTAKALRECADTNILVADLGLSIADLDKRTNGRFIERPDFGGDPTCLNREYGNRTSSIGWRLVRKTRVAYKRMWQAREMSWSNRQSDLNLLTEYVPSARELFWTIFCWFKQTNKWLFTDTLVFTSDVGTVGIFGANERIAVGFCGINGVEFSSTGDNSPSDHFPELASARKPSITIT